MTTENHSIEPLPSREFITGMWHAALRNESSESTALQVFAAVVAQWGFNQHAALNEAELQKARDEELEACCALADERLQDGTSLRAARRPRPKSLAEQKQAIHDEIHQLLAQISANNAGALAVAESIRRALERLRELEGNQ